MPVSQPAPETSVGAVIRQRRKRKGLGIRALGDRLGVAPSTISRWERGREFVPPARRKQIATLLEFDAALIAEATDRDLTLEECGLLRAYRALPASGRAALSVLLASLPPHPEHAA